MDDAFQRKPVKYNQSEHKYLKNNNIYTMNGKTAKKGICCNKTHWVNDSEKLSYESFLFSS